MSEMTPERVHRIARFASDGPDEFSAEVRDLARAYIAQADEIGRLKAIIRVNGLRAGATHAEIDKLIEGPK